MSNVRPETMERITTQALAEAFIAEQIEAIRAQVGGGKVLLVRLDKRGGRPQNGIRKHQTFDVCDRG